MTADFWIQEQRRHSRERSFFSALFEFLGALGMPHVRLPRDDAESLNIESLEDLRRAKASGGVQGVETSDRLIAVGAFAELSKAEECAEALEREGIRVFLQELHSGADWFGGSAGPPAIRIHVLADQAGRAQQIVEQLRASRAPTDKEVRESITFTCHRCSEEIVLPGWKAGGVEVCPHCSAYVDVPDCSES